MKNIVKFGGQLLITLALCAVLVFGIIGAVNLFIKLGFQHVFIYQGISKAGKNQRAQNVRNYRNTDKDY